MVDKSDNPSLFSEFRSLWAAQGYPIASLLLHEPPNGKHQ